VWGKTTPLPNYLEFWGKCGLALGVNLMEIKSDVCFPGILDFKLLQWQKFPFQEKSLFFPFFFARKKIENQHPRPGAKADLFFRPTNLARASLWGNLVLWWKAFGWHPGGVNGIPEAMTSRWAAAGWPGVGVADMLAVPIRTEAEQIPRNYRRRGWWYSKTP